MDGGFKSALNTSIESNYEFPESQVIDSVAIYGQSEAPLAILQNGQQVPDFKFTNGALLI